MSSSQITPTKTTPTSLTDINQFSSSQITPTQISSRQITPTQVNSLQIASGQNNSTQVESRKVSFPSIISSEQLLSSNIDNVNPQTISQLNNSVNHIWSTLLPQTNIDITYEIKDLPSGQLAEATITGFDSKTTYINGRRTFVGNNFTALLSLDGSHLDKQAHPHDLLNTHLAPGIRKLPSDINVLILNAIQNTKTDTYHTLIPYNSSTCSPLGRGDADRQRG